jgi:hypothetical protein
MNQQSVNVFRLEVAPSTNSYRAAVSEILSNIQGKRTDQELADLLGCSRGTISNGRYGLADMSPVTLARIGEKFGVASINPYLRLMGGRGVPLDPSEVSFDDLAIVAGEFVVIHMEARHPDSPCGVEYAHTEAARARKVVPRMAALAAGVGG